MTENVEVEPDDAFVTRLRAEMRRESQEAETLALAVGLPPSAKYQLLAVLSERAAHDDRAHREKSGVVDRGDLALRSSEALASGGLQPVDEAGRPVNEADVWVALERIWESERPRVVPLRTPRPLAGSVGVAADEGYVASQTAVSFLAQPGQDDELLARALVAAGHHADEADQARDNSDYRAASRLYAKARAVLEAGDVRVVGEELPGWRLLWTRVQLGLVFTAYHFGWVGTAGRRAKEGLELAGADEHLVAARVDFLVWLAELYNVSAQVDDAVEQLRLARDLVHSAQWLAGEPRTYLHAVILRIEGEIKVRQGDWSGALRSLDESLRVAKADPGVDPAQLKALEAYVERDRCRLRIRQGALIRAIDHCERGYLLRLELGHGERAVAQRFAHIADIYRSLSDEIDPHLRDALFAALEGFEEIGDDLDMARMHLRLARLYRKDDPPRPREARFWALRALKFAQRADFPFYQALACRQYGMALDMESYESTTKARFRRELRQGAEHHLRESLAILRELQDPFEYAVSQRALGAMLLRAHRDPERLADAESLLQDAVATFSRLQAALELDKAALALAALRVKVGGVPSDDREVEAAGPGEIQTYEYAY